MMACKISPCMLQTLSFVLGPTRKKAVPHLVLLPTRPFKAQVLTVPITISLTRLPSPPAIPLSDDTPLPIAAWRGDAEEQGWALARQRRRFSPSEDPACCVHVLLQFLNRAGCIARLSPGTPLLCRDESCVCSTVVLGISLSLSLSLSTRFYIHLPSGRLGVDPRLFAPKVNMC